MPLGIAYGTAAAVAVGLFGFLLLELHWAVYGIVVFLLTPLVAGFVVGYTVPEGRRVLASLILASIIGLLILVVTRAEGWVCVLMALPLIIVGIGAGAGLGCLVANRRHPQNPTAALLLVPLVLIPSGWIEKSLAPATRLEPFTTSATYRSTPEQLFNLLANVDHVEAHRPFLLRIGLPVPVSCKLERGAVGAKRTCYFDDGYIVEEVVAWSPPEQMRMRIVENHVPGRHWLGFRDAIYDFKQNANGTTTVTRTTSITTQLYPPIYWRPLERLGVETEHRYIFDDLQRRLAASR